MKIEISSYRAMVKELHRIGDALEALTAMTRHALATYDIVVPDPKLSPDELRVEVDYTDPEQDFVEEVRAEISLKEEEED